MHFLLPLVVISISFVSAQTFTTSILLLDSFISGTEPYPFVGDVIDGDTTALTYYVKCVDDNEDCQQNNEDGITVLQGPATLSYQKRLNDGSLQKNTCVLRGTTAAVCKIGTSARITVTGAAVSRYHQLTVTQGASFALAFPGGIPTGASASATGTASSPSETTASQGTTSAAVATTGVTAAPPSSVASTGGLPRVTGNAGYVVGGAMAAVAAVAGAL